MNIKLLLVFYLFTWISCDFESRINDNTQQINENAIKIREYIRENIDGVLNPGQSPRFSIIDSIKLIKLNSIIYKVGDNLVDFPKRETTI